MKEAYNAAERCRNTNIRGQFTKIYAARAFRKSAALRRTFARPANPPCGLMSKTDLSERLTLVICLSSHVFKKKFRSPFTQIKSITPIEIQAWPKWLAQVLHAGQVIGTTRSPVFSCDCPCEFLHAK
jgi:hypothetical protein